jgi:protein CpxP
MKKFILSLAAVVIAAGAYAHDSAKVKKSPEQIAGKKADKLKTELALSDEQRTQVYAVVLDKVNKTRTVKEKYKDNKDKRAMRAEMKTVQADFDSSMKGILTAEQYTKWQGIKEKQKEKHKAKHGKRGASKS